MFLHVCTYYAYICTQVYSRREHLFECLLLSLTSHTNILYHNKIRDSCMQCASITYFLEHKNATQLRLLIVLHMLTCSIQVGWYSIVWYTLWYSSVSRIVLDNTHHQHMCVKVLWIVAFVEQHWKIIQLGSVVKYSTVLYTTVQKSIQTKMYIYLLASIQNMHTKLHGCT